MRCTTHKKWPQKLISMLLSFLILLTLPVSVLVFAESGFAAPVINKNIAPGATVVGGDPTYGNYKGKVTDGVLGDYDKNTNWAAFYHNGNNPANNHPDPNMGEIVLDFGKTKSFTSFRTHVYGDGRWGIASVSKVEFSISNDGSTWTSLGTVTEGLTGKGAWAELTKAASGRYVKYSYTKKSASDSFIFVSECEAYSDIPTENSAPGATVVGGDPTYGNYKGKVTDGVLGDYDKNTNWAAFYYNGNNPANNHTDPNMGEIVLDFGESKEFSAFRTHIYGDGRWGICTLSKVEFSISDDGNTWTSLGAVTSGLTGKGVWVELTKAASGRYVKYSYTKDATGGTFMFVSECEAYAIGSADHIHSWDNGKISVAPTHLAEGEKTYTCLICGETKVETVPKLSEHTYGDWQKHDENQHKKVCACGDTIYADHTWDLGKVTKAPTCKVTGIMTYTCLICGQTKTEVIPVTNDHVWSEWKITKQATETEKGSKERYCSVCGKIEVHEIPVIGTININNIILDKNLKIKKTDDKTYLVCPAENVPVTANEGYVVKTYDRRGKLKTRGFMATGDRVVITYPNGKLIYDLEVVVTGDVNGDGKVTSSDYVALRRALLKVNVLEGAFREAAGISGDKELSIRDYIAIRRYILKLVTPNK